MAVAAEVYREFGEQLTITSVVEGKHSATSLHYAGCAFDCRIRDVSNPRHLSVEIKNRLTGDYDVILESSHIHIEYQPRQIT